MNHASENAMVQLIIDTMKQQCPDVRLIYLFGSRVGNLAREDSDWDIAILCARPLDQIQRWQLGETMAQKLHQDVDLVDIIHPLPASFRVVGGLSWISRSRTASTR